MFQMDWNANDAGQLSLSVACTTRQLMVYNESQCTCLCMLLLWGTPGKHDFIFLIALICSMLPYGLLQYWNNLLAPQKWKPQPKMSLLGGGWALWVPLPMETLPKIKDQHLPLSWNNIITMWQISQGSHLLQTSPRIAPNSPAPRWPKCFFLLWAAQNTEGCMQEDPLLTILLSQITPKTKQWNKEFQQAAILQPRLTRTHHPSVSLLPNHIQHPLAQTPLAPSPHNEEHQWLAPVVSATPPTWVPATTSPGTTSSNQFNHILWSSQCFSSPCRRKTSDGLSPARRPSHSNAQVHKKLRPVGDS